MTMGMVMAMTVANAQINVRSDGGVRIGTAPEVTGTRAGWKLTSKGLETNVGAVKFHLTGGELTLTGQGPFGQRGVVNQGGPISQLSEYTYLTGKNLYLGKSTDLVYWVYTQNAYVYNTKTASDRRIKENIKEITDARDVVMHLKPVTYDLRQEEGFVGDSALLKNKAGFIAQDVLDVLPGAVGYHADIDRYSLDYNHFIPYLTKTIQEQEVQLQEQAEVIEQQESRLAELEIMVEQLMGGQESRKAPSMPKSQKADPAAGSALLYQNTPNPFSEDTEIGYVLPADIKSAEMVLHAASGRMVRSYNLPLQAGSRQLTIEAGVLTPGMYTYSLVVDNQVIDTKRMVVTE